MSLPRSSARRLPGIVSARRRPGGAATRSGTADLYQEIVESHPELVCRFLPDGTLTFANESYFSYFGVRREDVVGKPYAPVIVPEDVPAVQAALASLGPATPSVVIQNRVVRGDGTVRWTEWVNRALYDARGRLVELQAIGRDVTDQRRAFEDSERLAAIVAGASDAIVGKTLEGVITSWNRGAEAIFGYTAEEVVGRPITVIIPPERVEEERDLLARLARGESIEHYETERRRKDGRIIPISLSVSPVRDVGGRVVGVAKIARDMTEGRDTQRRLRENVRTLDTLYRLAGAIGAARDRTTVARAGVDALVAVAGADRASILVFDDAGVMRFVAWSGLSEAYRRAVEGHSPWSPGATDVAPVLVEDVRRDEHFAALLPVFEAEGVRSLAFIPLQHRGKLLGKFMLYHDAPHVYAEEAVQLAGTVAQHVAIGLARIAAEDALSDLLSREQAARREADAARGEAERANRAKDEFLAMLAHELRNPLAVIVNAVSLVPEGALAQTARRAVQMIRRQAGHLARLLDDLLDVARITSGHIELEQDELELSAAVEQVAEELRPAIEARNQRLTVTVPEQRLAVVGDPVRIQQVLGNLLRNASKYTPPGGSIAVRLEPEGAEAVLRIRDDGVGIPAEKLDSIFDLFVQANPTLARSEGGLGIGLTLVKRLIELHGGTIHAASAGSGRGSEFVVRLPAFKAAAAAPRQEEAPPARVPRRVLVIEDNLDGREVLVAALQGYGHAVLEADSGRAGLQVASRSQPEVAIIDIGLPDIEGYEVAARLRSTFGDRVRLVALTGYGQPADRARSERAGFDAHLGKPGAPPALVETLDRLCAGLPLA